MARTPPSATELLTAFIDESSQTAHRYFALGGLVIFDSDVPLLEERIQRARMPELPQMEMGWKKVSRAKLDAYRRVVDVFFQRDVKMQPMHFHSLVIDCHKLKDKLFNKGSRDVGFSKEVFQLCMKLARLYPRKLFHVYPDNRTAATPLNDVRTMLNFKLRNGGDTRDWPFRRMHFRDSKASKPLQLTDILLGALTFKMNGHYDAPDASVAKRELCDHVLGQARISDVMQSTEPSGRFTIWHRQLR
jgi:hypothetical protein